MHPKTEAALKMLPARFSKNNPGIAGPDFYGCSSGMRPVIYYDYQVKRFFVGPHQHVRDKRTEVRIDPRILKKRKHTSNFKLPTYVLKTRSAAIKYFAQLCDQVYAFNDEQREEARKKREAMRNGSLEDAINAALS